MGEVFISYAHADSATARVVKTTLEKEGRAVWMDDEIVPGAPFPKAISRELDEATCVVVLWSSQSVTRPFVTDEARRAHRRGVLLPVLLGPQVGDHDVPVGLGEVQAIRFDMENGAPSSDDLSRLSKTVKESLESPAQSEPLTQAGVDIREKLSEHLKNRYQLINQLGTGSSSAVFRARSVTAMAVPYAIKVTTIHNLLLNDGLYESLILASETAYKLQHTNIVKVHNVEQKGDLLISVMPFVDGRSVASILLDEGLAPPRVSSILVQVAEALSYAHRQGITHLDLRPSKILVDWNGNAHVVDFGVARARVPERKRKYQLVGSPRYMSPEQFAGKGEPGGAADQYSLGVIAYEMLTGKPPYDGGSPMDFMTQHSAKRRRPPREPLERACAQYPRLAKIVLRMLEKKPVDRYPSLGAAAHALRHSLATHETDLARARASYDRCVEHGFFLDIFYDRFIGADPRVKKAFEGIDMDRQIRMLGSTLSLILERGMESEEAHARLKPVLESHRRMVENRPELFVAFEQALLSAVQTCDAACDDDVASSWRHTVADCIEHIRTAGKAKPRTSTSKRGTGTSKRTARASSVSPAGNGRSPRAP